MEALTTHLSDLGVVSLSVTRYSSAFSSLASALAVLRFFSAAAARSNRSVRRVSGPALAKRYRAPARSAAAAACAAPRFFVGTGQVHRPIISWELARGGTG
jgi:hypothetical protein